MFSRFLVASSSDLARTDLVEPLEPRQLLAAVSWDGGGDGTSWHDPANWSNDVLPGATDDVTINPANNPTVRYASGLSTIRSLDCRKPLVLSGGTLAISQPSFIRSSFELSGGTLGGAGNTTLSGDTIWSGGSMEAPGRTIIPTGATLTVAAGGGTVNLWRNLDNAGTMQWASGRFDLVNANLTNLAGGLFIDAAANVFANVSGSSSLTNAGTYNHAGGATIFQGAAFNNNGTASVLAGSLSLQGGGFSSGALNVVANTQVMLQGTHAFFASSSVTGDGNVLFSGGTTTMNGTFGPGSVTFDNATVTFNGTFSPGSGFSLSNGSVTVNAPSAVNGQVVVAGGLLTVNGAAVWDSLYQYAGEIAGSGVITVPSLLRWHGGTMSGTGRTVAGPGSTSEFYSSLILSRTLENAGLATWSNSNFQSTAGRIINLAGGTWNAYSSTYYGDTGANLARFENAGRFLSQGNSGNGGRFGGGTFSNTGTVELVGSGGLDLNCAVPQVTAGVLTGGTWIVTSGSMNLGSNLVSTNRATLELGFGAVLSGVSMARNEGTLRFISTAWTGIQNPFTNAGLIEAASASTGSAFSFNNDGTVRITAGTLAISTTGTHSGAFEIRDGSTLNFLNANTLTAAALIHGSGSLDLNTGSNEWTNSGTTTLGGGLNVYGQRVTFDGSVSAGTFGGSGGTVAFNGPASLGGGAPQYLTVQGSGDVTITGAMNFRAGEWAGTGRTIIPANATLRFVNEPVRLARRFENRGLIEWGTFSAYLAGATIANLSGGTLAFAIPNGAFGLYDGGAPSTIENDGTLSTPSSVVISAGITLNNRGTVSGGTWTIDGGGTNSGSLIASRFNFSGGYTFDTGTVLGSSSLVNGTYLMRGQFRNDADVEVTSATLDLSADQRFATFRGSSSLITGAGDLTLTILNHGSSTFAGTGRILLLNPAATQNGGYSALSACTIGRMLESATYLSMNGVITLDGGDIYNLFGGTIASGRVQFVAPDGQARSLDNAGTLLVQGGESRLAVGVALNSTGAVQTEQNAWLRLQSSSTFGGVFAIANNSGTTTFEVPQTFLPDCQFTIGSSNRVLLMQDQPFPNTVGLNGGEFDGAGSITLSGSMTWSSNAVIKGDGRLTVLAGATMTVNGSNCSLFRHTDNFGSFQISGGRLSGNDSGRSRSFAFSNAAGATFAMTFGGDFSSSYPGGSFTNSGAVSITSGSLYTDRITNVAGATFNANGQIDGAQAFINNGFVSFTGGNASSSAGITNNGTWTHTNSAFGSSFANAVGATISVTSSTFGAGFTNAGTTTFVSGSSTTSSSPTSTNTGTMTISGGTLTISHFFTNSGAITVNSGATLVCPGYSTTTGSSLTAIGTANLGGLIGPGSALSVSGTLTGDSSLSVDGTLTWTGGTFSGTSRLVINAPGVLNIATTTAKALSKTIDNYGTANWTAGTVTMNSASFNNLLDGVFAAAGTLTWARGSGAAVFQNLGTFTRSGSATSTTFSTGVSFNNAGVVNVTSGALSLAGSGLHSGQFSIVPGHSLVLAGNQLFGPSARLGATGTTSITGGVITINGNQTIANLTLSGGTLQGLGDLSLSGAFAWSGGAVLSAAPGPSAFILLPTAVATITGGAKSMTRNLTNQGVLNLATHTLTLAGEFVNAPEGTLTTQLGGTSPSGGFGRIAAESTACINGTLTVTLTGGFIPALGNTFDIVTAPSVTCTFAHVNVPTVPAGAVVPVYGATFARLSVQLNFTNGTWTGLADGVTWSLPGNWANNTLPDETTDVHIEVPGTRTIMVDSGEWSVRSIHSDEALSIAGRLTITGVPLAVCESSVGADVSIAAAGSLAVSPNACLAISGDLLNAGRLYAEGTVLISGAFAQTGSGELITSFDELNVSPLLVIEGSATLDGTLTANARGGFDPSNPAVFLFTTSLLSAGHVGGQFANLNLPATAAGTFVVRYNERSVDLLHNIADFNADGGVDGNDIEAFFTAWENGIATGDVNGDGGVDGADIEAFFTLWEAGGR